ncbi:Glucuronoxylan 4-O-methyltransferase 2 [Ananas comosus]|uniref:Glucuronoxylan 4-O-methyltransferase 2 n=1 Tax=Ananas comosus TaxID=4615 RepID=A0A199UGK5_ANACO|nr:Glucuronoxylan 4-O-methyltransferase 2 [Ananas comosus]
MKAKLQNSFRARTKPILLGFSLLIILLLLVLRSNLSPTPLNQRAATQAAAGAASSASPCAKLPASVADAIVHYATSNVTPQQTLDEISVTARVLARKSPCNFLVFGLGHDSPMWSALNQGGRTVFLEEDAAWIATVREKHPALETYHVAYDTRVSDAEGLLELGQRPECTAVAVAVAAGGGTASTTTTCRLALKELPRVFDEVEWDVIMVDAPTGWIPEAPGRMGAIYTAGMAARMRRSPGETDVFVHDVDRPVEDKFSRTFLCDGYLKEQQGRLRHFAIPSHLSNPGTPFCP